MSKHLKITLSDEAAYQLAWLVENEKLRYPSIAIEQMIDKAVKKYKIDERPVYIPSKDK